MTKLHPITPSPELIEEWIELSRPTPVSYSNPNVLATYAARWGADRELQFCLDWFQEFYKGETWMHKDLKTFMAARRPKLKSQAEEALDLINRIEYNAMTKNAGNEKAWDLEELEGVRRALKRLQELEKHDD
jgi:hypothetical protein